MIATAVADMNDVQSKVFEMCQMTFFVVGRGEGGGHVRTPADQPFMHTPSLKASMWATCSP